MMFTLELKVYGRVQLVMFRDFIKRFAARLGLKGYVQNKSDGSVYILAFGKKEELEKLIKRAQKGSLLSRVGKVEILHFGKLHINDNLPNFYIKY